MRRHVLAFCAFFTLLTLPGSLAAQSLRDRLSELFLLGGNAQPLQVAGSAVRTPSGNTVLVTDAFVPNAVQANATVVSFLTNWIGANVAAVPIGSTISGPTFRIEGGVPVEQSVSPGPIYAERAGSLGQGRWVAGVTQTGIRFTAIRGVPLENLRFNFVRQDAGSGVPAADDVIEVQIGLNLDLAATSFFLTYGLSDRVDVGLVVPVVSANLQGSSQAQVVPFILREGDQPTTFLAGSQNAPVFASSRDISGSATGLGDISGRLKVTLADGPRAGVALMTDVRFPTGDEADLLGAGSFSARALGIVSGRLGAFSPHLNVGYQYWESNVANDAVLATVGFDQVLAPWATFAASVVSELQVGESEFRLPDPVTLRTPFPRTVQPAEIPNIRDDAVSTSLGFKFIPARGITATINALVPVARGGPRPDLVWNVGVEYGF